MKIVVLRTRPVYVNPPVFPTKWHKFNFVITVNVNDVSQSLWRQLLIEFSNYLDIISWKDSGNHFYRLFNIFHRYIKWKYMLPTHYIYFIRFYNKKCLIIILIVITKLLGISFVITYLNLLLHNYSKIFWSCHNF